MSAGELVRALAALAEETRVQLPQQLITALNSKCAISGALFWPPSVLQCGAHKCKQNNHVIGKQNKTSLLLGKEQSGLYIHLHPFSGADCKPWLSST